MMVFGQKTEKNNDIKNMYYKLTEIKTQDGVSEEVNITVNFDKVITISPFNDGKNTMLELKNQRIIVKEEYNVLTGILTNWCKPIIGI